MRARSIPGIILALLVLCAPLSAVAAEPVILGQRITLQSAALGEQRTVQVHRPTDYEVSARRYPVLFVTDGEEHFRHVSATVDFLAAAGEIPPMIVVGIPNTDRYRDLLGYTKAPGPSPMLKFITSELAPRIDAEYRTLPYRLLFGWSDGGLFVLHALMNAPDSFRGYISLATAIGDDQAMASSLSTYFAAHPAATLNADLYMGMDDVVNMGLARAYEVAGILQQRAGRVRDLRFTFHYYPTESHMELPLRGVQDGLLGIFEGWNLEDAFALYEQGGLAAIEKHYTALAQRFGFPVVIPPDVLFSTFNRLEGDKRFDEADRVIKRAIDLYPQDTTALYYQARLQSKADNKPLAVETLKKALQISPNDSGARGLLRQMQVDPDTLVAEVKVAAQDLAKFVGQYGTATPVFFVELRGDKLYARTQETEYRLSALTALKFRYAEPSVYANGGAVSFHADARGRVTGLAFEGGPEFTKLK